MNLYNLTKEYLELIGELEELGGELTPELEQSLVISEEQLEQKCVDYGWAIKHIGDEVDAISNEIKRLQERKKSKERVIDRLKENVTSALNLSGKRKLSTATLTLSLRKSESVFIEDEGKLPKKFMVEKVSISPDKKSIKDAIKAGGVVTGASLVEKENLQLK